MTGAPLDRRDPRERLAPLLFLALALLLFPKAMAGVGTFFHYDTWLQNLTFRAWWFAELEAGHFATWCPGMFAGYPLFAETQTGPLYPPTFALFLLLPPTLAFSWSVGLHFAWAGIGAWWLARRLGATAPAALAAGIVFELSGFLITHVVHFNLLTGAAWMPWALGLALGAAEGRTRSALGLAGVVGCLLLGAHPYATLMTLALVGWLLLLRAGRQPRALVTSGLAAFAATGLGAALAAVQILPTRAFLEQTTRGEAVDWSFLTFGSFPPWQLPTLVAPDLFGTPVDGSWWAGPDWSHFAETCAYVGMPAIALAVVALFRARGLGPAFAATTAGLSLLLMLGKFTPAYRVLTALPLFESTRLPARFALPFTLAIALLAAFGLDALLREREAAARRRALALGGGALLALAVAALFLGGAALFPDDVLTGAGRAWASTMDGIHAAATRNAWRTLILLGLAAVVLAPFAARRRPSARLAIPVLALLALDPLQWGAGFNPLISPDALHEPPPVVAALPDVAPRPRIFRQGVAEFWTRSPGQPRVDLYTPAWKGNADGYRTGAWALPPNTQLMYGIDSGEGFTSLLPLDWLDWMGLERAPGATPRPDLTEAQADLLALDAVLSSGSGIAGDGWETRALPGDLWLSRNRDPFPRVRLARSWTVIADRETRLARLRAPEHDPRSAVILEAPPTGLAAETRGGPVDEALTAEETAAGAWRIEVPEGADGLVVLAQRWDPDWVVEGPAGARLPTFRADGLFFAFVAPPEGGTVIARHAPKTLLAGAWLSGVALLLGIVAWFVAPRRWLRPKDEDAGVVSASRPGPRWVAPLFAGAFGGVVIASAILDIGGWRQEFRDSRLAAAAVRSWSDEAFAAHRAGAHDAAARLLRRAARLRPDDVQLQHRLGLVEAAAGAPGTKKKSETEPKFETTP